MKLKTLSLTIATMMLMVFASCKKGTVDTEGLLRTIPANAPAVVVFDIENLLNDADCKISGDKIELGKELKRQLEEASSSDKEVMYQILNGDSGVNPKVAVMFMDKRNVYLTMALKDEEKFLSFMEQESDLKFSKENGVMMATNVAVKDSQMWVVISTMGTFDALEIKGFTGLKPSESFLTTPGGEKLLDSESDIRGWANMDAVVNLMTSPSERASYVMAKSLLFNDAESVLFSVDCKKGELVSKATVLDSKNNPAKFLFDSGTIDESTVKGLGETCDLMFALNVNKEIMSKIADLVALTGDRFTSGIIQQLSSIDGTIGIIGGGQNLNSYSAVVTTDGSMSESFTELLHQMGPDVQQEGNLIKVSKGDVTGNLKVSDCAAYLKGSTFGMVGDNAVMNGSRNSYTPKLRGAECLIIKMCPEDGGIAMEITIKCENTKRNAIFMLLEN